MTQQTDPAEVARVFHAEIGESAAVDPPGPRYNVAPTQPLRVVVQRPSGRFVEVHRWGLVPAWQKAPTSSGRLINARLETAAETPAFRTAFAQRRCIVPADAFYEWRRAGRARQPFPIHPLDGGLLPLAGLWSAWRDPASGAWLLSCAVVTKPANEPVGRLHDRMPVMLPPTSWATWLDPTVTDAGLLRELLEQAHAPALEIYPVSARVNDPANEGPDLVARYDAAAPLTLFADS